MTIETMRFACSGFQVPSSRHGRGSRFGLLDLPVNIERQSRGTRPGELARARQACLPHPLPQLVIPHHHLDRRGPPRYVVRIQKRSCVAEHLWNRRRTRRNHWRAAGHRFEHRQPEAFVP